MKVYRSIFLLMSGLWYLIWYGLAIVWMLNMYKKTFRSRVIFVYNKMLWKKDLNFVGKIFYFLKVINRKKDLDLRFKDDKIKLQKKFYQKQSFFEVLRSFFIDLIFNIKKDSNLSMLKVKQISKIYPTMQDLYAFMNNKANSNYNIFYQKKKGLEISHNQEQISTFSAEHNQDCYALNYKWIEDIIEVEQNLEIENKLDKFIIDKPKEIINSLIKEDVSRELINFVDKQMESCKNYNDAPIKYIKTIGYHKSNLTTTPTVNSKVLYEIFPKKFLYTFKKKGIIHINRNDKDFLRSIADFAINYEDSKLQNKNISEKEHQNITLEVLKGIGGYKDIEFYNDVTKKKIFLEFTICAWIYLKNKQ